MGFFRYRVDWYTQTVHTHIDTHLKWSSCKSCLLAFIFMVLSWTRRQRGSLLGRADADCHCLNPKRFTGQLVHWSMKPSASQVPQGQLLRQTAYSWLITQNSLLLNRKVIITRRTGTRSVLIYNEVLSGGASKPWIHLGLCQTGNTL